MKLLIKENLIEIICIILGIIIFGVVNIWSYYHHNIIVMNRETYSRYDRKYEMEVRGLVDKPVNIEVPVSNIEYKDEDIYDLFEEAATSLRNIMLGDNESFDNIKYDMNLPSMIDAYGFKVDWFSDNTEIIDSFGHINNGDLDKPINVGLRAELSYKNKAKEYYFRLRILPKEYSKDEKKIKDFLEYLNILDKQTINEPKYTLPSSWQGKSLIYKEKSATEYSYLIILSIFLAILINMNRRMKVVELKKSKEKELILDYSEVVSKLMVFIGAGLSVRNSWEAIVRDYEENGCTKRYIYQEMKKALLQLNSGVHESTVYKDFGRRCALKQYMKLSSLLEQNRKNGINNFKNILEMENSLAWQERVNIARRYGEEASTKLLIPLFMMLIVVMVMVIAPAIMSFY